MIYLKHIFDGSSKQALLMFTALFMAVIIEQAVCSKIAYKKPIQGAKTNVISQEKQIKGKTVDEPKTVTTTTITSVPALAAPPPSTETTTTTPTAIKTTTLHDDLDVAETTHAHKTELNNEENAATPTNNVDEQQQQPVELSTISTLIQNESVTAVVTKNSMEFNEVTLPIVEDEENNAANQLTDQEAQASVKAEDVPLNLVVSQERAAVVEEPTNVALDQPTTAITTTTVKSENPTPTSTASPTTATTVETATNAPSNRPSPCTCGVFMTSQIKRTGNPYEPPKGRPVIINELDRTYPCNAVGQKQCQTKCLETIVQHLPNSANILCASLDHDIRKERAYLFIKNCRNQWFNTNLAAGREYCCKNGQPYQCPLV